MNDYFKTKSYNQLVREISRWMKGVSKPVALLGDIGVGKTRLAEEVASEMGYELIIVDMYNYEDVDMVSIKSMAGFMGKIMLLLDRPHEYMRIGELKRLLQNSANPVLIEAEKQHYKKYAGWTTIVWVDPPPKTWIAKKIREKAIVKPQWNMVTTDVRQAMLIAMGSMGYKPERFLEEAEKLFRGEKAVIERSHLPILLATILDHSYGYDLLHNIKLLASADLLNRYEHLRMIKNTFRFRGLNLRFYDKLRVVRENGGSH